MEGSYVHGLDNSPPSKMTRPASLFISFKRSFNSVKNYTSLFGFSGSGRFCLVTNIQYLNFIINIVMKYKMIKINNINEIEIFQL